MVFILENDVYASKNCMATQEPFGSKGFSSA